MEEDILQFLQIKKLDPKVCKTEVQQYKLCTEIKGRGFCKDYLEMIRLCYSNKGRMIKK